jgi:hypothetical protein
MLPKTKKKELRIPSKNWAEVKHFKYLAWSSLIHAGRKKMYK